MDEEKNGNGKVPLSVVDKIVDISQKNNESYNEIVSVLDTLSASLIEVRDALSKLEQRIAREQLAEVLEASVVTIKEEVESLSNMIDNAFLSSLSEYLKFNNMNTNDFIKLLIFHLDSSVSKKENQEALMWAIGVIGYLKRNWGKFMVAIGATLTLIYINGGKNIMDIFSKIIK